MSIRKQDITNTISALLNCKSIKWHKRRYDERTDATVTQLAKAIVAIDRMRYEESNKFISNEIAKARGRIKYLQDQIQMYESDLNKIYEAAADAMNLLEEHGVDIDAVQYARQSHFAEDGGVGEIH